MSFKAEQIPPGSPIEQTPEYQQASKQKGGLSLGRRIVDSSVGATLYVLSVGGDRFRPPGKYALFYKGEMVRVKAHLFGQWVAGVGRVFTYDIFSVEVPDALLAERTAITALVREALEEACRHHAATPVGKVEFVNPEGHKQ
jgi:hypothetical protein